jgi:hypothetical protein
MQSAHGAAASVNAMVISADRARLDFRSAAGLALVAILLHFNIALLADEARFAEALPVLVAQRSSTALLRARTLNTSPVKLVKIQLAEFAMFSFVTRFTKTALDVVAGAIAVVRAGVVTVTVALGYHELALVFAVPIAVVLA